ncbi:MAG: OsmC family protein [Limnohabitans sp.]|nr:OsmC family protein [Limnohabitans sp.]
MKIIAVKAISDTDKLYTQVQTENKIFFVDEPVVIGGTDLAPNPLEYFLGSLASCICITLQLYAKRKNWNPGKIEVNVQLDSNDVQNKKISKTICFENHLSSEQIERLLSIAEKCPVSKLISEAVPMTITNV